MENMVSFDFVQAGEIVTWYTKVEWLDTFVKKHKAVAEVMAAQKEGNTVVAEKAMKRLLAANRKIKREGMWAESEVYLEKRMAK